jgi:hypothetical protein
MKAQFRVLMMVFLMIQTMCLLLVKEKHEERERALDRGVWRGSKALRNVVNWVIGAWVSLELKPVVNSWLILHGMTWAGQLLK